MARVMPPGSAARAARMPHVGELFTDRTTEAGAFKEALAVFRRQIDDETDIPDARHNVLTFYGMGGIGKTALSHRLEDWVNYDLPLENGWGPPPSTRVAATARIDLHESGGQVDVVSMLLALRAGVAKVKPRWPLFDLAFAAYWTSVRPGEDLPSYRGSTQLASAVVETLQEALTDVGSIADLTGHGTGAGLAVRGVRKLIRDLRRRHDVRLGVDAYAGFEDFLVRCADEPSPTDARPALACEIAGTLAWEMSQMMPAPLVAVFVDTTERLALDPRRSSESQLNQLVYELPNVLFVLTGRDMLAWWDETRVELTHRGPWTWPGLTPGALDEPRQHLVGNLSEADTMTVIRRGRTQLDLPMSDLVVRELATASGGLPQYLELARQVALSVKDSGAGRQVTVNDVTGSLSSLVMRVLDDVPADEQRAIRAAALFRTFDTDLVAAAADVDHGCAQRAVSRPMIDRYDGQRFPYRMHDAVREALRAVDHHVPGGWSPRDWQIASTRAAAAARQLHDQAKSQEDNRGVLDAVGIAISLVCEQPTDLEPSDSEAYEDWLAQAIVFCPSIQGLRGRVPASSKTEYGRHVLSFIDGKSVDRPIEERLRLLRQVFDAKHPLSAPAGRHLGYGLRGHCRWDEALSVFAELAAKEPRALNLNQRPITLSMARRFVDARDALAAAPEAEETVRRTGEFMHGIPERYFLEIIDKIALLRARGRQREYLEERGTLLWRRVLFAGDVGEAELDEFLAQAEESGHSIGIRSGLSAAVMSQHANQDDRGAMLQHLRIMDQAALRDGAIGFRYAQAEACDALVARDGDRIASLAHEVAEINDRSRSWIPVEVLLGALGLHAAPCPTQWLEPHHVVVDRWIGHWDAYLARHGSPGLRGC